MKRGQAELLGLVFIVLILVLALLLYTRFKGQNEGEAITIRSNTRVNNMLNALMLITVEGEKQMKDVLIERCGVSDNNCGPTLDLVEGLMDRIKEPNENYELEFIGFNGIAPPNNKIGNCEEGIAATPAIFKRNFKTTYTIKLKLC